MNPFIMFARTFIKMSNICPLRMKARRFSCEKSNDMEIIKNYSEHNYRITKYIYFMTTINCFTSIAILLIK